MRGRCDATWSKKSKCHKLKASFDLSESLLHLITLASLAIRFNLRFHCDKYGTEGTELLDYISLLHLGTLELSSQCSSSCTGLLLEICALYRLDLETHLSLAKPIIFSWRLSRHPSRYAVLYTASVHANSRSWYITNVDPGHVVHVWIPVCL